MRPRKTNWRGQTYPECYWQSQDQMPSPLACGISSAHSPKAVLVHGPVLVCALDRPSPYSIQEHTCQAPQSFSYRFCLWRAVAWKTKLNNPADFVLLLFLPHPSSSSSSSAVSFSLFFPFSSSLVTTLSPLLSSFSLILLLFLFLFPLLSTYITFGQKLSF